MEITREYLRERFDYHPDGYLINRVSRGKAKAGSRAGDKMHSRYCETKVDGVLYNTHRLIYIWHHGEIRHQIDHINNDRTDNRIHNLRDVPQSVNQKNRIDTKRQGSEYRGSERERERRRQYYLENRERILAAQAKRDKERRRTS